MFRKSHSSCYRSHVNSTDNIQFSKPRQYENNNLIPPYIVHAAIQDQQGDNKFTSSVTFDPTREKCTCEQLNFCEIHTVSNKINKSLDYSNKIKSTYKDIPSIIQSKDAIQLEKEMKLHNGTKFSSEMTNRRNYDFKQYLVDNNAKNNTIALELIPILNISDDKNTDHKRRDYLSINFEINKSINTLTNQSTIKAHPSAKPIYTKSKRNIYHKDLSLPKCQYGIDGVSNIYRSLMGPTPDESILAGLQTVYNVCNNKGVPKKQIDHGVSNDLLKSSSEKETSSSGTYMNYSTICITPTKQKKSDYSTYKDQVKYSFTPSLIHSSSSFNTCSPELENISINSFSRELSYEFPTLNKNKNRRYATLTPCHFNPLQVTPTVINICDRICFSEASVATGIATSSNSVDKSKKKMKTSKNTSKKSRKSNSDKNDSKDSKSNKSSKSIKSSGNKKSKVKKSKGTRPRINSVSSKSTKLTQNKKSKLSKKSEGSNKASRKSSKKKTGAATLKNRSSSNESDVTLSKQSIQGIPCDDPGDDVITISDGKIKLAGPCYSGTCGVNLSASAAGILPREIKYAITKISRFHDYTTYEIMKSSERKPSKIPVCTEGVFILQNKRNKQ